MCVYVCKEERGINSRTLRQGGLEGYRGPTVCVCADGPPGARGRGRGRVEVEVEWLWEREEALKSTPLW